MALVAVPAAAAAPLSIRIEGNHFVNGEGQAIRLLGVNHSSSEYDCIQGNGTDDGHFDDADAAAIAAWNANAVRIPLNEDCWLGLNGYGGNDVLEYRQAIESYVAALNAHGLYAILDLHWSAPGIEVALEQQPMPDAHSTAFWTDVATAFKGNPAVVFDLFNEPFSPTDPRSGDDLNPADAVSWNCWENGGCSTASYNDEGKRTGHTYTVVGMQTLVDAIRATGATQPVMVGGLDYANDLSQWADHAPDDPLNQEAASFHNYMGKECDNVDCWNSEIAAVAANVPVVTGEFAEDNFENSTCANKTPNNFDNEYMSWADAHGVSYLAWAWLVESPSEIAADECDAHILITDYSGTPASPNGVAVRNHLLSLPPGGRNTSPAPPAGGGGGGGGNGAGGNGGGGTGRKGGGGKTQASPIKLTKFHATVLSGGKVRFRLEAAESCTATVAGRTVKAFKLGGGKPRKVGLGSAHLGLAAGKPGTVTLKLPAKARGLLAAQGSLRARFTVTLSGGGATTSTPRVLTLGEPQAKSQSH